MMMDNTFLQVYLGKDYVNNPTLSDVTFLVEGLKNYYFHEFDLPQAVLHNFGKHSE